MAGLHHVCVAAVKDQRYATCRYSMDRHIRWPLVVDQLADDVAVANQLLPQDKQVRLDFSMRERCLRYQT